MVLFQKYQGLGNDFIIIDCTKQRLPDHYFDKAINLISSLCDRRFGIGADGIIFNQSPSNVGDSRMQIFNSDGSQAEMCGNGIRCLARYLFSTSKYCSQKELRIETLAGLIIATQTDDKSICVDMGQPFLDPSKIPTTLSKNSIGLPQGKVTIENKTIDIYSVGMGNPHLITYIDNISDVPILRWGPLLESNEMFPSKTNVHFVSTLSKEKLHLKVWERGSGETMSCGTGACASAVCSILLGKVNKTLTVSLSGGDLTIKWNGIGEPVLMTGEAQFVYAGEISLDRQSIITNLF